MSTVHPHVSQTLATPCSVRETQAMAEMNLVADGSLEKANIVLQVHRSHLERVVDFICTNFAKINAADEKKNENFISDCTTKSTANGGEIAYSSSCSSSNTSAETSSNGMSDDCIGAIKLNNAYRIEVEIVATKRHTCGKTCSLVFLRARDENAFLQRLSEKYNFVFKGMNKVYLLHRHRQIISGKFVALGKRKRGSDGVEIKTGENISFELCLSQKLLPLLKQVQLAHKQHIENRDGKLIENTKQGVLVKVEAFPHKLQHQIVSSLNSLLDKNSIPEQELDIAPNNQTHTLSIIQLDTPTPSSDSNDKRNEKFSKRAKLEIQQSTFFVGVTPSEKTAPPIPPLSDSNDICRAFYKLAEAFDRYRNTPTEGQSLNESLQHNARNWPFPNVSKESRSQPLLGVDCGAAPGGWTKYLIDQTECDEVFSIDPGKLSESLSSLPSVHHLQMTAAEAIPRLRQILSERNASVGIWVSDMCVHEVSKQVDVFLYAKNEGIFAPDAAFVLTIKCNVGHAKERFDELTEKEVQRLRNIGAYGMKVFHLFSNRNGERTVMGFLK